ncbi:HNH endonuclease family protein [Streptomyces sp. AS13]|uniref:HNH endonuclease family protein n=1 Tax=Streptomyces sp. AS13 TaxID=3038080 RepID=UPI00278C7A9E|nr:HNH endonuclease family protein [Streptomyces sp. AS13]
MVIKKLVRGLSALSLALVPLLSAPAAQAAPTAEATTLSDVVGLVQAAQENRTGYTRSSFKHWNSGEDTSDGCNTRNEVLISEAVIAPTVEAGCKLTGGTWISYYDGQEVTSAGALDIDHMVPLAEAWDSGASAWTAARREAYANDQEALTSLVAVTARTNRSKADQDPTDGGRHVPSRPDLCTVGLKAHPGDRAGFRLSDAVVDPARTPSAPHRPLRPRRRPPLSAPFPTLEPKASRGPGPGLCARAGRT